VGLGGEEHVGQDVEGAGVLLAARSAEGIDRRTDGDVGD